VSRAQDRPQPAAAKTRCSFSTDPQLRGAPQGFAINVREVRRDAGAELIVMSAAAS
jgi:formate--tetrahydrofolate ligase